MRRGWTCALGLTLVACGSSSAAGDPGDGGSTVEDAGNMSFDHESSGACNDLVNAAPRIDDMAMMGEPPAGSGGTIGSGTYYLTSLIFYNPSSACVLASVQTTMSITASGSTGTMEFVDHAILPGPFDSGPNDLGDHHSSDTFTTNGVQIVLNRTCPAVPDAAGSANQGPTEYTATDTELRLIADMGDPCGTVVNVFEKQ